MNSQRTGIFLTTLFFLILPSIVDAQNTLLEPWQVVRLFIQEIASTDSDVNMDNFADFLTGEAKSVDILTYRNTWEATTDVLVESTRPLPEYYVTVRPQPLLKQPGRIDTIQRVAINITTKFEDRTDHYTFFCELDSIWRIESWRQFPNRSERLNIDKSIRDLDSNDPAYYRNVLLLTRLLFEDNIHFSLFESIKPELDNLLPSIAPLNAWSHIDLSSIEYDSLVEYGGLDDTISPFARYVYRTNTSAMQRLVKVGMVDVYRDEAFTFFEIGSFGGKSLGFVYASDSAAIPPVSRDTLFTLRAVPENRNWWIYKGWTRPMYPQESTQNARMRDNPSSEEGEKPRSSERQSKQSLRSSKSDRESSTSKQQFAPKSSHN